MTFHWMDGSGVFWLWGLIPMLFWVLLLVLGIILVLRLSARSGADHRSPPPQWGGGDSAEEILRRRFAAGEIDEDEYRRRLDALRR